MFKALALFFLSVLLPLSLPAQNLAMARYDDSVEGFRQQIQDLVAAQKDSNEKSLRILLDALAIPSADDWITEHFSPADASKLRRDYPSALATYQKRLFALIEKVARASDSQLDVQPDDLPAPPGSTGPESET